MQRRPRSLGPQLTASCCAVSVRLLLGFSPALGLPWPWLATRICPALPVPLLEVDAEPITFAPSGGGAARRPPSRARWDAFVDSQGRWPPRQWA